MPTPKPRVNIAEAQAIMHELPPVRGEMRTVELCNQCGRLFGCRFIPYGLGHGLSIRKCMCQLTNRTPSTRILESRP